ncbi:hypothetical protein PINS_up012320 [Pythium insidiosum]|nr:hypothetical protein PINS_up012320 [Pythium insidiosum]
MNASVYTIDYDDFWGVGPRRGQVFVYSVSAPGCDVVNLRSSVVATCRATHGDACAQWLLDSFDDLQADRSLQVGVEKDFGTSGVPFLRRRSRPERPFLFKTDLMVQQAFWAGADYQIEMQTSDCRAMPLLRDAKWRYGLFQVEPVDRDATVIVALPPPSVFGSIVTILYGFISISMIINGVLTAFVQSRTVLYLPKSTRFRDTHALVRYLLPFMSVATSLCDIENAVITLKGSLLYASDMWMNHWLYITISMLEALVNIRLAYVVLEMGTWMLTKKIDVTNFLFLCSALARITWIVCFVHTVVRLGLKFIFRSLKRMHVLRPATRKRLDWCVDSTALFLSFKVYNVLLFVILYLLLEVRGRTTLMHRLGERSYFGGTPPIKRFWDSEIACDLLVLVSMLLCCGHIIAVFMLGTKHRALTYNGVIRLLQERYVVVGWDVLLAAQVLEMDPYNPDLVVDGHALTNCSLGSLLRMLYESGPSGCVHLAGDVVFTAGGLSKPPVLLRFQTERSVRNGLAGNRDTMDDSTVYPTSEDAGDIVGPAFIQRSAASSRKMDSAQELRQRSSPASAKSISIFARRLRVVSDGYLAPISLVDEQEQPTTTTNTQTGRREFLLQDVLSCVRLRDVAGLLGNEEKLHIL